MADTDNTDNTSVETGVLLGRPQSPTKSSVPNTASIPPPSKLEHCYTRPLSFASRHGNRLSLSFPIQISHPDIESTRPMSTSSDTSSEQPSPLAELISTPSPNDSSAFLVALAAQERRVLELKEEFNQAEAELSRLKLQWTMYEASKKRTETRHAEQQQLLQDYVSKRSEEVDRRKAVIAGLNKEIPSRKVIRGGHTRALSLLSSDRSIDRQITPDRVSLELSKRPTNPIVRPLRGYTQPETSANLPVTNLDSRVRHSFQDGATSGVKQFAEDIKAGLRTFMDDLRQATIGEEAIISKSLDQEDKRRKLPISEGDKIQINVKKHSISRSLERASDIHKLPSDAVEPQGLRPVTQTPPRENRATVPPDVLDDDWSNWDSPLPQQESNRWSNSTAVSSHENINQCELARFGIQSELWFLSGDSLILLNSMPNKSKVLNFAFIGNSEKQDQAPWAPLNGLTPTNIKRTASAFMKEWEKSLLPVPEVRHDISCKLDGGIV